MEREPEEEMKILDAQKGAKFKNPPFSGWQAQYLLADRAYNTNSEIEIAQTKKMEPVIPLKRKRKDQREYNAVQIRCMYLLLRILWRHALKWYGRMQGTIIFCINEEAAEQMRKKIANKRQHDDKKFCLCSKDNQFQQLW